MELLACGKQVLSVTEQKFLVFCFPKIVRGKNTMRVEELTTLTFLQCVIFSGYFKTFSSPNIESL